MSAEKIRSIDRQELYALEEENPILDTPKKVQEYAAENDDSDQKTLNQLDQLIDAKASGDTGNPLEHQEAEFGIRIFQRKRRGNTG
ncbi:MAG: hypothetical protein PUC65_16865 [Clostridiales bacterium]|nr:hypothetical protein [Clostridiales bacterium]